MYVCLPVTTGSVRLEPASTYGGRSLLSAADSRRRDSEPEDRLTEILAVVLTSSPNLAGWLVQRAFPGMTSDDALSCCSYGSYEVVTQVGLVGGGRPDMEFRFAQGCEPGGGLYCENKIHARWTRWQSEGYPAVKRGRIVFLSPTGRLPPGLPEEQALKLVALKWNDVGDQIDGIGRAWAGPRWDRAAMAPDAPSEYRLLVELLIYLRGEGLYMTVRSPLTPEDLGDLPKMDDVVGRWKQFRDLVRNEALTTRREAPGAKAGWEKNWDPEGRGQVRLQPHPSMRRRVARGGVGVFEPLERTWRAEGELAGTDARTQGHLDECGRTLYRSWDWP